MSKTEAFICDIDGTVANHVGLRHHYDYAKVSLDTPIWPVIFAVRCFTAGKLFPLFVSGRMDENSVRPDTCHWLAQYGVVPAGNYALFMRADKDYRPDDVIKEEIYRLYIEPFYDVKFVLDDRNRVVDMWRRIGLHCFQVAPGDF